MPIESERLPRQHIAYECLSVRSNDDKVFRVGRQAGRTDRPSEVVGVRHHVLTVASVEDTHPIAGRNNGEVSRSRNDGFSIRIAEVKRCKPRGWRPIGKLAVRILIFRVDYEPVRNSYDNPREQIGDIELRTDDLSINIDWCYLADITQQ